MNKNKIEKYGGVEMNEQQKRTLIKSKLDNYTIIEALSVYYYDVTYGEYTPMKYNKLCEEVKSIRFNHGYSEQAKQKIRDRVKELGKTDTPDTYYYYNFQDEIEAIKGEEKTANYCLDQGGVKYMDYLIKAFNLIQEV